MLTHAETHEIKQTFGLPAFIKESELTSEHDLKTLPPRVFADPVERRFPCHTKTACYVSNAQFWPTAILDDTEDPEVGKELIKMAKFWGIFDEVKGRILTKVSEIGTVIRTVSDFPDEAFALHTTNPSTGEPLRLFPIIDGETTKLAGAQLYANRCQFPLAWRKQAATRILQKAAEYNIDFDSDEASDYLERAAGRGVSSAATLADVMLKRAYLLQANKQTPRANVLKKAAASGGNQRTSRKLCEKVASMLDTVDRESGLFRQYGREIDVPEAVCHAVLMKHASLELDKYVQLPSGNAYRLEDLKEARGAFEVVTGLWPSVAEPTGEVGLEKAAKYLPQLDMNKTYLLEQAFAALNIEPTELPFDLNAFR